MELRVRGEGPVTLVLYSYPTTALFAPATCGLRIPRNKVREDGIMLWLLVTDILLILTAVGCAVAPQAEVLTLKSTVALQNGDLNTAIELAREALALSPSSVQLAYNLFITTKMVQDERARRVRAGDVDAEVPRTMSHEEGELDNSNLPGPKTAVGHYERRKPWGWEWTIVQYSNSDVNNEQRECGGTKHLSIALNSSAELLDAQSPLQTRGSCTT